jgi:hypothetical protein
MLSEENTAFVSPKPYQTDLNQYDSCKWSPNENGGSRSDRSKVKRKGKRNWESLESKFVRTE